MGRDERPPAEHEGLWRAILTGDEPYHHRRGYRRYPGTPRGKTCPVPLGRPLARVVRLLTGPGAVREDPNYCNLCESFARTHPGGAEVS